MIDIEDKSYLPSPEEISELVDNPLFDELKEHLENEFGAQQKIEYSGDKVLLGWNVKYKKAGRTLCTVYPRKGHFPMLLIVGRKEKERVEAILPEMSSDFLENYESTQEGMGQRWMLFDFRGHCPAYDDVLKIIKIRRESK